MFDAINLPLILAAAFFASISPGPATLAIAGTSMKSGRSSGLALASGITSGSLIWSVGAAAGLGALMAANAWVFELIRYFGAAYLLFLAFKSAKSAISNEAKSAKGLDVPNLRSAYTKGLALHLTNPKAILFFGALYAIGIPADAPLTSLLIVIAAVGVQSAIMFHGLALLFSSPPVATAYARLSRAFDTIFALAFGGAGLKILTAKLD